MFLLTNLSKTLKAAAPARRAAEAVAVVLSVGLVTVLWPVERVTWENFDRIRVGMTGPEVHRLLGYRPVERFFEKRRVDGPGPFARWDSPGRPGGWRADLPGRLVEVWNTPGLAIMVIFDERDRVAHRFTGTGQARRGWADGLPLPRMARDWLARLL